MRFAREKPGFPAILPTDEIERGGMRREGSEAGGDDARTNGAPGETSPRCEAAIPLACIPVNHVYTRTPD
jgi:hypothetical protein